MRRALLAFSFALAIFMAGCTGPSGENDASKADRPFLLTIVVEGIGETRETLSGVSVRVNGDGTGTGTALTDDSGTVQFELGRRQTIDITLTKEGWAGIDGPTYGIHLTEGNAAAEEFGKVTACVLTVIACFFVFDDGPPNIVAESATFHFVMAPDRIERTWTGSVPLTADPLNQKADWYPVDVKLDDDQETHDFYRYWTTEVETTMQWKDDPVAGAAALELGIACGSAVWDGSTGDDSFRAPGMNGGSLSLSWKPYKNGFLFFEGKPLECPAFKVGPIVRSSTGPVAVEGTLVAHLESGFQRPTVTLHE